MVYSTPRSFSKSKIPNTIAVTRFPNDAIEYELTTPSADSIDGMIWIGFSFLDFSKPERVFCIFFNSVTLFTLGITIPSIPFWIISFRSDGIFPDNEKKH